MRAALIALSLFFPFFFYFPEVTLSSLLTAGAANVRQNVCSVVSHSRGYFGPGVGGVQVVHLVALQQQNLRLIPLPRGGGGGGE